VPQHFPSSRRYVDIPLLSSHRRRLMWRLSFSGVRELRDDFKPRFAFQLLKRDQSRNMKLKTHFSDKARCQIAIDSSYFTDKWRVDTQHTWFRIQY
jgi:hypothetical protein